MDSNQKSCPFDWDVNASGDSPNATLNFYGDGLHEQSTVLSPLVLPENGDKMKDTVLNEEENMIFTEFLIAGTSVEDYDGSPKMHSDSIPILEPGKSPKILLKFELPQSDDENSDSFFNIQEGCDQEGSVLRIADTFYSHVQPVVSGCPFKNLHHSGLPTEFLHYPGRMNDKRALNIITGIDDVSSGVPMKVQFIVNNLKDCLGIWPQLFLQKLNSILVYADQATVRAVLSKDNFSLVNELASYYAKETRCGMVFRYWCFMYNAFSRNLLQVLPAILKNKLLIQLQTDFSLAAQNSCRCKLDTRCNCSCELDEENRKIGSVEQLKITGILFYYLICKIGNHSRLADDVYEEEMPSKLQFDQFIEATVVPLYIQLHENSKSQLTTKNQNEQSLMEILAHFLMAYNTTLVNKSVLESSVQLMLDMGCLSSAVVMKDALLNILQKESDLILKGSKGLRLIFYDPEIQMYFTTLGLPGVLKALNNLLYATEYDILSRDDMVYVMDMIVRLQICLGQTGLWNDECENIYLHCRQIQSILEQKMGYHVTEKSFLESTDTEFGISNISSFFEVNIDSSDASQTSQSKLNPIPKQQDFSETEDEWQVDVKNIAKMRKGYENEISGSSLESNGLREWVSKALDFICVCSRFPSVDN